MSTVESRALPKMNDRVDAFRTQRRQLKGDLDNILLKALRKEPARRYASAEQLSDDIRRHLNGLPVSAVPDSVFYRANKFVRRHKTGVAAAILLSLAVLGGVKATLTQARIATANERKAERRFNDVRKLANSLMFELHDSIENLPGATPARKLIVERALQYLDSLAQESNGDLSLQRELASAYKKVGDVQGYPFRANLGDTNGAVRSYQKALAIRGSLARSNPGNVVDAIELSVVYRRMAEMHSVNQDITSALAEGKLASQIGERLAALHPQDADVLQALIKDDLTLAGIEGGNINSANLGNTAAALTLYKKAASIAEKLAVAKPNDTAIQRLLAGTLMRLGDQLSQHGEPREALKQYLRATEITKALFDPQNQTSTVDLSDAYSRVGTAQMTAGNVRDAVQTYNKQLTLCQHVVKADPSDSNALLGLALANANLGEAKSVLGQNVDGLLALKTALTMSDKSISISSTADLRNIGGMIRIMRGGAQARSGKNADALHSYEEALRIFDSLYKDDRNNLDSLLCLGATYNKVGSILLSLGETDKAAAAFQSGLKLAEPFTTSEQLNAQAIYVVADSYTGLGNATIALTSRQSHTAQVEKWRDAQSYFQKSLKAWSQIKDPGSFSPDGFESVPPSTVKRQLDRCQQALQAAA